MKNFSDLFGVDKKDLEKAGIKENPSKFMRKFNFLRFLSLIISTLYPKFVWTFLISLVLPKLYLHYLSKIRRERISLYLPLAIVHYSALANLGKNALTCLDSMKDFPEIGGIIREVLKRHEKGLNFEEALMETAYFPELKQFFSSIAWHYKTGSPKVVEKLAQRMKIEYIARMREKSSKIQLLLTLHTTLSALTPTLIFSLSPFFGVNPMLSFVFPLLSLIFYLAYEVV